MADNYNVSITLTANDKTGNAVGQVNREMDDLKGKTKEAGGLFGDLGSDIQGALGSITIGAGLAALGNLGEAGREAHIAESAFESLAGQMGSTQSAMEGLAGAGGGLIDDTDLYREGAKLLSSQAVTTQTDMESLVKSGIVLGTTFAGGAKEGVEALSQAIEGMNYRGLKALGISIPETKARVEELTKSGLGLQDAFRQAALEQAASAANNLGGVAYSATTRLNIALQDVKDTLGEIVAGGIEAGAQLAQLPGLLIQKAKNDADTKQTQDLTGYGRGTVAAQTIDQSFKDTLGSDFVSKYLIEALQYVNENPSIASQAQLTGQQMADLVNQGYAELDPNTVYTINDTLFGGDNLDSAQATAKQYIQGLVQYAFDQNRQFIDAQQAADQQRRAQAVAYAATASNYGGFAPQTSDLSSIITGGMTAAEQQLNGLLGQAQALGGVTYFTPEQHNLASQMTQEFKNSYDYASKLHDQGVLSDDAFAPLKDANTEMQGLIDKSKEYSGNLDKVMGDLNTILGVGNGGLGGQVEDRVLAYMKAHGATDQQIQSYQGASDMTTGRNTLANQMFNNEVLPQIQQIMQTAGASNAALATQHASDMLDQLVQQGASPEQIEKAITDGIVTGFKDIGNGKFEALPGTGGYSGALDADSPFGPMIGPRGMNSHAVPKAQGGFYQWGALPNVQPLPNGLNYEAGAMQQPSAGLPDYSQMAASASLVTTEVDKQRQDWLLINGYVDTTQPALSTMAQDAPALATGIGQTEQHMLGTQQSSQKVHDLIGDLTSKKQVINVQINATNPDGLLFLIMNKKALGDAVQNNGGVTPGSDSRRN